MLMLEYCVRPSGETVVHVVPLSRVRWMRPLVVPAQISPAATGDGANVLIAVRFGGVRVSLASRVFAGLPLLAVLASAVALACCS